MEINDIWGKIVVDKEFETIVKSKEFKELKLKSQLGFNPTTKHTRYDHSIGVHHIAKKLIEICKKKFSKYIDITKEDEDVILIWALIHDIGHGPFSHVAEKMLPGSHEERNVKILSNKNTEVHNAIVESFSEDTLKKVINLFNRANGKITNDNKLDLSFIVLKLLSGGLDIDRLDYITRDSKNLNLEVPNYLNILEAIDLEYINGEIVIVFNESAEYELANFFLKRFEMYDKHYEGEWTLILESLFKKYIPYSKTKLNWDTDQSEILLKLKEESFNSKDLILRRYSDTLFNKEIDENYVHNEFEDEKKFMYFKNKILSFIPELSDMSEAITEDHRTIKMYTDKNKIYIRKNGKIIDFKDATNLIDCNIIREKFIFTIDLKIVSILLKQKGYCDNYIKDVCKKAIKLSKPDIEQEIKFELTDINNVEDVNNIFDNVFTSLNLNNSETISQFDTYYDTKNIDLYGNNINLRSRVKDGVEQYDVKAKLEDVCSSNKRIEMPFTNIEDATKFIYDICNVKVNVKNLKPKCYITTIRKKAIIELYGGVFEIAFDYYKPNIYDINYPTKFMVEVEHKSGSTIGLFHIDQLLQQNINLIKTNRSKLEISYEEAEIKYERKKCKK